MTSPSPPRPNLKEIRERAEAATAGPWSIESCGEKGDGANMIGTAFGPKDVNAENPLQGWLRPWDDAGDEIEYYRDELVAVCDHVNRNCGHDAEFIAAARTDIPLLLDYIDERDRAEDRAYRNGALAMFRRCSAILDVQNGVLVGWDEIEKFREVVEVRAMRGNAI